MTFLGVTMLTIAAVAVGETEINRSAYNLMPPLYGLDSYDQCLDEKYGYYCVVHIELIRNRSTPLLEYILKGFSNFKKNYRHDHLQRGICLTNKCKEYIPKNENLLRKNRSLVVDILDKCINRDLDREYGLEAKILVEYCNDNYQSEDFDGLDIAVGVIIITLILFNVAGSTYDLIKKKMWQSNVNEWLTAFSLQRNWKKLNSSSVKNQNGQKADSHIDSLKALQGMRFLSMIGVIFSHLTLLLAANYLENPLYIEASSEDPAKQLIFNGNLIIQTYFCIASFLTAYNFMISLERKAFDVWIYPKGIMYRWLRLTPVYAVVLAYVATWAPRTGNGPLWDHVVTAEKNICRQYWWTHLLYINNYNRLDLYCLSQTWYLGADTQLFCYGFAVMMVIWKFPKVAKFIFPFLVIVAILIPAIETYVGEYDAVDIQAPEVYRTWYKNDRTFQDIYITGHTNAAGATMALWAGYLLYKVQRKIIDIRIKTWHRVMVYLMFPFAVAIVLSGSIFYQDNYVYSPLGAAIYAGLYKALFSLAIVVLMFGFGCGIGGTYEKILKWQPLRVPGKLTYCALFIHTIIQKALVGSFRQPFFISDYTVYHLLASSVVITYLLAVPLCLMVEIPTSNLQKLLFNKNNQHEAISLSKRHRR